MQNDKIITDNAKKVFTALKVASMWEGDLIKVLFPKPEYSKETAASVWQWEVNMYGRIGKDCYNMERPVNGESVLFTPTVEKSYWDITREAVYELKALGLLTIKNNGYNEYSYHVKNNTPSW